MRFIDGDERDRMAAAIGEVARGWFKGVPLTLRGVGFPYGVGHYVGRDWFVLSNREHHPLGFWSGYLCEKLADRAFCFVKPLTLALLDKLDGWDGEGREERWHKGDFSFALYGYGNKPFAGRDRKSRADTRAYTDRLELLCSLEVVPALAADKVLPNTKVHAKARAAAVAHRAMREMF